MAIKLSVISTKGGTGKTTLAVNLGAILADLNQRVLLVDADPQPTASSYFSLRYTAPDGLSELITRGPAARVISRTSIDNLDLIASDDPAGELREWILHDSIGRIRLKHALAKLDDAYDIIIVDTQGAVGPLQDAAAVAVDLLLSPIPPEILSAREFVRGTVQMLDHLAPMIYMGAPVPPLKGIIYRQDRTTDAKQIAASIRQEFFSNSTKGAITGAITILDTVVPATAAYKEAATRQMPVHRWETKRRGPTPSACETMLSLVRELLPHLETKLPWSNEIESAEPVQRANV